MILILLHLQQVRLELTKLRALVQGKRVNALESGTCGGSGGELCLVRVNLVDRQTQSFFQIAVTLAHTVPQRFAPLRKYRWLEGSERLLWLR